MTAKATHLIPVCSKCGKAAIAGHETTTGKCWTCTFTHHL